jgi:DNA-binding XRE family transcriptional regulator
MRTKLIPFEELKNEILKTKEEKYTYNKDLKLFKVENEKQILLELSMQLKRTREKAGMTQAQLAKKLKTNKGNISRMENGKQNLTVGSIIKVAGALNRPVRIEIL